MNFLPGSGFLFPAIAVLLSSAFPVQAEDQDQAPGPVNPTAVKKNIDFQRDVKPILSKRCFECHGAESQEGELRLDIRSSLLKGGESGEPSVVVGKSQDSPLFDRVSSKDSDLRMPPDGKPLTQTEIEILRNWIDQGVQWPKQENGDEPLKLTTDFWSFQPLQKIPIPQSKRGWGNNAIDALILRKLHEKTLKPSAPADRVTLIRRLYLDMLGLPPTSEEVADFVNDKHSDAYEKLVNRVLISPHYGERWARHWLDVVRFAETDGFEMNQERANAYYYRDYVIESLNQDKPYDRFIFEQIAGDAVGVDAATGFLVGGAYDKVKGKDPVLNLIQRQDELADIINTTGTTFLGLTLGCAKCHSHKFDPIPQKDYYSIQAIFTGVQHGERPLKTTDNAARQQELMRVTDKRVSLERQLKELGIRPPVSANTNEERFEAVAAKYIRFSITQTYNNSEPCIDELEIFTAASDSEDTIATNVALASAGAKATASGTYAGSSKHKLEHINDGKHGNSYSWISNVRRTGWVQIELAETTLIDRIVWGRDREKTFNDRLPTEFVIEIAVQPNAWKTVASSSERLPFGTDIAKADALKNLPDKKRKSLQPLLTQLNNLKAQESRLSTVQAMVYAGRFTQPKQTHRLYRGDPLSPREVVHPGALSVIGALNLTNETPEQERRIALAKWIGDSKNPLTARVLVNRIWHYHFGTGIVDTPSDFGRNGGRPTHPKLLDWLAGEFMNHNWSIKHIHRLILLSSTYQQSNRPHASGLAVDADSRFLWRFPPRRLEAEVIRDEILEVCGVLDKGTGGPGFSFFEPNKNYVRVYTPLKEFGPKEWRRMVYSTKVRMEQDAVFSAFDCPDAGQVTPRRNRSTTAIQALNLFNSRFIQQQSEILAKRLQKEMGADTEKQVQRAFQLTFGRDAAENESTASIKLIAEHGLPALCRALFNSNEFLFLP